MTVPVWLTATAFLRQDCGAAAAGNAALAASQQSRWRRARGVLVCMVKIP